MYRRNVACIFINSQGKVLVGKRKDLADSWQFPQGGIDPEDVDEESALRREMQEEVSIQDFTILQKHPELLKYDFPSEVVVAMKTRGNFVGQEQRWFLARFNCLKDEDCSGGAEVPVAGDEEFEEFRWVSPQEALSLAVHFKREVYQRIMEDFGLL